MDVANENAEACEEDSGCEHLCRLVSGVPTCVCNDGYRLEDVTACVDVDECSQDNGGCAHECRNKPGTYTCKENHH